MKVFDLTRQDERVTREPVKANFWCVLYWFAGYPVLKGSRIFTSEEIARNFAEEWLHLTDNGEWVETDTLIFTGCSDGIRRDGTQFQFYIAMPIGD